MRLLLASTEPQDAARCVAELERTGFPATADVCQTTGEFLAAAESGGHDLLILDAAFWPYREALAALKERAISTPLIVIATEASGQAAIDCLEAGAYDCILKDRLYRLSMAARRIRTEARLRLERESADNSLRGTIDTLRAVIEACPLAIIALDAQARVQSWNPGAEALYGWNKDEVLGRPLPTVPEIARAEFQSMLEAQLRGQSHSAVETVRIRKDGTPLDVSICTAPLRDAQGNINGKLAVIADISDKKHAFQERVRLREQERQARADANSSLRFRQLLESAPDAIFEVDSHGAIVIANAEAERLFGFGPNELIGQTIESLIPARFRPQHAGHRADYSHSPTTRPMGTGLELYATRRDGSEFAVDINLSPFQVGDEHHVICIVRNVTERKLAEEQIRELNQNLEQRNREVERANRLKSEFLASMSHELRTPLNAILGFSELLSEQTAAILSPKQKRFLGHIQQGAKHLLELINDILDLSKIEAGRLELRHENFDMAAAAGEVLASVKPIAAQKSIQLDSSMPAGIFLTADRLRYKEILYNLFSNAIKFTPDGGRVWIESVIENDSVITVVGDTGIGIPREEHASIFESFHQVGATTKGVREGTGLGLAITRRLVEHHQGKMWMESTPGEGSRFYFALPIQPSQAAAMDPGPAPPASRTRPLILVVEDDRSSQELIVSYLESEGYLTLTAGSAAEALRIARERKPDLITLDMLLPDQSGFGAMHELKACPETSGIPVVVVSVVDEKTMGLALGATEYLVKPVSKEALLGIIKLHVPESEKGQVMVVDDEAHSLHLTARILTDAGYPVLPAQSGMEALRVLSQSRASAVVLDLIMPEMNGFELLKLIRERPEWSRIPMIVLTAKDLTSEDRARLRGHVAACLDKSSDWRSQLLNQLRTSLNQTAARA